MQRSLIFRMRIHTGGYSMEYISIILTLQGEDIEIADIPMQGCRVHRYSGVRMQRLQIF
jgi:hypothetical protein